VENQTTVTCFLVKVASRCNLNCDYCYMYHHADQSWKKMPAFLSRENEELLANRIAEYTRNNNLERILIVYHGGEPLLAGIETIERITSGIRKTLPAFTKADFSLQTNGTLLTEVIVKEFERLDITVSLSIDGPESASKHRLNHAGKPSFFETEAALKILEKYPKIFGGVISVIDVNNDPESLLEYFNGFEIPSLDFLLPDANYNKLPPGRNIDETIYKEWLIKCFDFWFDRYPHLAIRFFDAILDSLVGLPSKTDALGFGDVSLLTIETDGTFHDLDVLKVAFDGATSLNMSLRDHSVEDAINSLAIQQHRSLLRKKSLCEKCQNCEVVEMCAGGPIPHRYSDAGFENPSIYCEELLGLILHAKKRLTEQIGLEVANSQLENKVEFTEEDLIVFENSSKSYQMLEEMMYSFGSVQIEFFCQALKFVKAQRPDLTKNIESLLLIREEKLKLLSIQPSVYSWTTVMNSAVEDQSIFSIDGDKLQTDYDYVLRLEEVIKDVDDIQRINRNDYWLRAPFGEKVLYEDAITTEQAQPILDKAYNLINAWDENLFREITLVAPEIQFIKDSTAHPDKIVSFSDNSVPGALYVTVKLGENFITPEDLADSILHEYRHQKLYLLQRLSDVVLMDVPLVKSPWREELRPPSGLYHAIYVFTFLRKFWHFLESHLETNLQPRAAKEVSIISGRIDQGLETLKDTKLSKVGTSLIDVLVNNTLIHSV
jgi:uncharacterized protein